MGVTIKDVAKAASVSVATVSRALNGHQNVAEGVRARVLEAAGAGVAREFYINDRGVQMNHFADSIIASATVCSTCRR